MKRIDIILIYLGAFFISFSYGIFLSIPLFIDYIGGNEAQTGMVLGISGIGTIGAVLLSKILFKKMPAKYLAAFGGLFYCLGALCFMTIHSTNVFLFISIMILGLGWGLYYNSAPYTLSLFATDKTRSMLFSYLSAFSVLGTGLAPVFIKIIWGNNIRFEQLFIVAAITGVFAFFAFYFLQTSTRTNNVVSTENKEIFLLSILKSKAIYPMLMVLLGACTFTMMLNFQTTFANSIGMNYAFFYLVYSVAVVVSRLSLGKYLVQFDQYKLCIGLLAIMTLSLVSFSVSKYSLFLYGISSALFGASYGLVYPVIQAIAVNVSEEKYRPDVISYFSLFYFIGVYAFPPIGGLLIVNTGYTTLLVILGTVAFLELVLAITLYYSTKKVLS